MIFTPTLLLAPGGTGTSLAFSHHPCFLMPTTDNLFSLSAVRHSARKRLILALKGLDRLVGVEFLHRIQAPLRAPERCVTGFSLTPMQCSIFDYFPGRPDRVGTDVAPGLVRVSPDTAPGRVRSESFTPRHKIFWPLRFKQSDFTNKQSVQKSRCSALWLFSMVVITQCQRSWPN